MSRPVLANDLPYTLAEEDPREALRDTLAYAADDWGTSRAKAWIYGIILGWDGGMEELAERYGWDAATVARLRRLHAAFAETKVRSDDS